MFPAEEASLTYAGLKLNYTVGRKLKTQTCIMEDVVCGELVLLKGNRVVDILYCTHRILPQ